MALIEPVGLDETGNAREYESEKPRIHDGATLQHGRRHYRSKSACQRLCSTLGDDISDHKRSCANLATTLGRNQLTLYTSLLLRMKLFICTLMLSHFPDLAAICNRPGKSSISLLFRISVTYPT